jgi:type I restriction enzyme S subunit
MAGEWRDTTLGDVLTLQRGFDLPETDRKPGPYPVIASTGPVGYHEMAMVKGPGVVIGRSGSLGGGQFIDSDFWPLNTTLWVKDFKGNDPRFCYYLLKSLDLAHFNAGSGVPTLNRNHIHPLPVKVPGNAAEQRAIAHILGTLDDKIELNRRMSETLEAMARALFKSWFMDFDPVRAKMEGRWRRGESLPGLPAHLYDLFPDRLVPSELGEIPEGWEVGTLADYYEAVKGVSYKGSGLGESGMPLHNLNSVYEGGGYKYEGIKYYSGEYAERHVVLPGDVIVANTEQGHDRLLIGYAAIVPMLFGEQGIASHHIYRLRPKPGSPLTSSFLCWLLNSPQMHDLVSGYANGTTVNMLPIDGVQKPLIVCPPRELVAAFDSLAMTAEHRRQEMVSESRTLAALRDALLPKLISGDLRVRDAERFFQERGL